MSSTKIFGANRLNATLTIRDGAANYIISTIIQMILQFLMAIVIAITMPKEDIDYFQTTITYVLIVSIINEMSMLITPISYSKVLGQNFIKDVGFKKKLDVIQILLLIFISIFTICAFMPLAQWFVELLLKTGFDASKLNSISPKNGLELTFTILIACVIPAIVEEILFRGIIARAFSSKNFVFAILMGAFLFAIMHGSAVQFVFQLFFGAVCCIVYFSTRSIYASMIVHFVNNLISVIGNYILTKNGGIEIYNWIFIIMMLVGVIVLPILLYLFIKISNKDKWIEIQNLQGINSKFNKMFESEDEKIEKEKQEEEYNKNLEKLDTAEAKEVYENMHNAKLDKNNLVDRRALIFALLIGIAIWVINTVLCYL